MSIQQHRINATLNKKTSVDGVIMTRREFMESLKTKGYTAKVHKERMYDKEDKEQAEIDRLKRGWTIPTGNQSHPATIAFNKRVEALKEGFYKDFYLIGDDNGSYTVTKTEYDYFLSL